MGLTKGTIDKLTEYMPELKRMRYKVTFDSSYLTGGEELDCTDHFSKITSVRVETVTGGANIVQPNPSTRVAKYAAGKVDLMALTTSLVEVASTTNLSALIAEVIVEGPAY